MNTRTTINRAALATMGMAFGLLSLQTLLPAATAEPSFVTAQPITATIDLERLFNALDQRAAADTKLTSQAAELEATAGEKRALIKNLEEEIEVFAVGSTKYMEAQEKLTLAALDYEAYVEFGRRKIDLEKAQVLRQIYLSIKDCAGEYARQNNLDLVLVDDSVTVMSELGTEADMMRQISARRVLFASDAMDITADLIAFMNNARAAGTGCD